MFNFYSELLLRLQKQFVSEHESDAGVEIAACGICLDFYGVKENVGVGSITNMYAITDAILGDNIVKL